MLRVVLVTCWVLASRVGVFAVFNCDECGAWKSGFVADVIWQVHVAHDCLCACAGGNGMGNECVVLCAGREIEKNVW